MSRTILARVALIALCGLTCCSAAEQTKSEITDPVAAQKDPDFNIQGEYAGEGMWLDGQQTKVGAQVIALGNDQFTVVVTKGGLPGDGWKRGDPRFSLTGIRTKLPLSDKEVVTNFTDRDRASRQIGFVIKGGVMSVISRQPKAELALTRTVRRSPTEGAKPPQGAVLLFDGTTAKNFTPGVLLPDGNLLSGETSKQGFGDYTLHVEFRLSYMPTARGQGRSNSGVYLHDCYEIQVLDSFGLEGEDNECGGFYRLRKPDVNMCYPPLTWQTYDVDFVAPKFKDGKKAADARVEVRNNGVVIHPEFELAHSTPGRQGEGPSPRPLYLQGHGNQVEYRNIWMKAK